MFNIAYSSHEVLTGVNKVTLDYAERSEKFQYKDYVDGKANDVKPSKKDVLLKYVYNGKGGRETILKRIELSLSKSNLRISPEEVYDKLIDELHRVGDYDDDRGETNTVQKYVTSVVLNNLMKTLSTFDSPLYDPHYHSEGWVSPEEADPDRKILPTEMAMESSGSSLMFSLPEDSMASTEEKRLARRELVMYLDQLYNFQISSSSNKDEEVVTNQLKLIQMHLAHEVVKEEAAFVESVIGNAQKQALGNGSKPDSRKVRRFTKSVNQEGNDDKYHTRIARSSVFHDFTKDPTERVFFTAAVGIQKCCDILEIPLVLLDAQKIMKAAYIRDLFSRLNGQSTLCITEYDLLEYQQPFTYADAYLEAIEEEVKTIKVNGSTLPNSKMHLVITPEVRRAITGVKLEELRDFNKFVKATATRGVEVWRDRPSSRAEIGPKAAADASVERANRINNDTRMATYSVAVHQDGRGTTKKGPAHPDTISYIREITKTHRLEMLRNGTSKPFDERQKLILDIIYDAYPNDVLEWQHTYLFNRTRNEFVKVNVSSHIFNAPPAEDKSHKGFCDFLINEDGYLVSNYISVYVPHLDDTRYYYNLETEFAGLIILTPDKKVVHSE